MNSVLEKSSTQTPPKKSRSEELRNIERDNQWTWLIARLGKRYANCRLSNFETNEELLKKDAVASVLAYCESMGEEIVEGRNVIFLGPPGTGKDHLMTAMMFAAVRAYCTVEWINGVDFFGDLRDTIDSDALESDFKQRFVKPDVLAISDPIPPWGDLTAFQAAFLFRVIDARYRQMKPVWVTANLSGDAERRLGAQLVDRLRHDALVLSCNWISYRQAVPKDTS